MTRQSHAREILIVATAALLLLSAALGRTEQPAPKKDGPRGTMNVSSSAFPAEGFITTKFTCEGANISPPLNWTGVPPGTKSVALICDDPDAPGGTWVHWVLYNLPVGTNALAEKVPATATLPNGARQGVNDFGKVGYGGPCPPAGKPHHYFFKLYALDIDLALKPGATKKDVERAMEHHILADGLLMGKYQRKK
jgi:Raf kinase inhibitor-like YbhB/YbcL family protein